MRRLDTILDRLRATGDVFETAPGLVGLRGQALVRLREIDQALAERCVAETRDEWAVPAALPLEVLRRARYFEQFPQWLTTATPYQSAEPSIVQAAPSGALLLTRAAEPV